MKKIEEFTLLLPLRLLVDDIERHASNSHECSFIEHLVNDIAHYRFGYGWGGPKSNAKKSWTESTVAAVCSSVDSGVAAVKFTYGALDGSQQPLYKTSYKTFIKDLVLAATPSLSEFVEDGSNFKVYSTIYEAKIMSILETTKDVFELTRAGRNARDWLIGADGWSLYDTAIVWCAMDIKTLRKNLARV